MLVTKDRDVKEVSYKRSWKACGQQISVKLEHIDECHIYGNLYIAGRPISEIHHTFEGAENWNNIRAFGDSLCDTLKIKLEAMLAEGIDDYKETADHENNK